MKKTKTNRHDADSAKRAEGRFYTKNDAFSSPAFAAWLSLLPGHPDRMEVLEPFAGACHIPAMLKRKKIDIDWHCFDIAPAKNKEIDLHVKKRDVLDKYPKGFSCVITNPPYLAKNSAKRRNLPFPETSHDDIYKLCLETMLNGSGFVAAIIPESFITQGLFHERAFAVVSLIGDFFDDTDCPVCLAMFVPKQLSTGDFEIWRNDTFLGMHSKLREGLPNAKKRIDWTFNDPKGTISVFCCDSTKKASIRFGDGDEIPETDVGKTSRALTRVSGLPANVDKREVINEANKILHAWRNDTKDILMTSFKGLRDDRAYRRRLDFATARKILDLAVQNASASQRNHSATRKNKT